MYMCIMGGGGGVGGRCGRRQRQRPRPPAPTRGCGVGGGGDEEEEGASGRLHALHHQSPPPKKGIEKRFEQRRDAKFLCVAVCDWSDLCFFDSDL